MGQPVVWSPESVKFCLIWEQAILAMLTVALYFLYLGGWGREANPGCVQEEEGHAVAELLWDSGFPSGMRVMNHWGARRKLFISLSSLKRSFWGVFVFGHAVRLARS